MSTILERKISEDILLQDFNEIQKQLEQLMKEYGASVLNDLKPRSLQTVVEPIFQFEITASC